MTSLNIPVKTTILKHGELLLAMNDKMNTLIDTEVDEPDNGNFLPGKDANWAATKFDP